MRSACIVIAGLLSALSGLPYVLDIAKNKTHPNLMTWVTWMLVAIINTAAAVSKNAIPTAILSGAIALTDALIVAMSIKKGVKRYTAFDVACQLIAIIGLGLWLVTGNPSLAVALLVSVILIAALPTLRHAWIAPFEETWQGFVMGAAAGALTFISLNRFTFVALAFPIATMVNCTLVVGIILQRRHFLSSARKILR